MSQAVIDYLNSTDPWELFASDFALLKSGYDKWSRIRWPVLSAYLDLETTLKAAKCRNPAAVARWVLRGLNLDKAILKAHYDAEAANQYHALGREEKKIREVIG